MNRYVGRSVCRSPFAFSAFLGVFCITAPAQMLELAFFITAPAHPHATSVAVYTALFLVESCDKDHKTIMLFSTH